MIYIPFLILPILAWGGIQVFRNYPNYRIQSGRKNLFPKDYFIGLNYLLNEEPDKAVDVFIKLLEVDSDTVETHLALGSLFRRRGEVDRAIRIHQNLIARPQLDREQRTYALFALGQDYLSAGVLDRAERLFLEVVECGGESTLASLLALIEIYQREKAWEAAISTAQKYEQIANVSQKVNIAHYYCELAVNAEANKDPETALRHLRRAQTIEPNNVRVSLLLGEFNLRWDKAKIALKHFMDIVEQDPDFISESVKPMARCLEVLGRENEIVEHLQAIAHKYPRISVIIELVRCLERVQGTPAAMEFLLQQLQNKPSLRGIQQLIRMQYHNAVGEEKDHLVVLRDLTDQLLSVRPVYRCTRCGFHARTLHWLCPGCHNWNTVKPIQGIEGD